ncbi:diphthine synthase [Candidatus Woesearchaeota archaeon]|nr:diphthine synthase [Candidatus Woesearchaeota archaeon]MBW2994148.1 diphthine synthase [Candidatus Woesearchaeota archaeon]
MTLYFIGLGLNDEKDITVKGLNLVKKADVVYLENYTAILNCPISYLEKQYEKKIILADRDMVEQNPGKTILKDAKDKNVAFLVVGDPFGATTHMDLLMRAKKAGIKTQIVHNASILSAIGVTGLQVYKFGKTTSIPFPEKGFEPETPYDFLKENQKMGLHTLLLLDLRPKENKFMTISDAINTLLKIEMRRNEKVFTKDTLCIGCAKIGSLDQQIKTGKSSELSKLNFGPGLHCLIVPGKLHFAEEEVIEQFK